MDTLTLELVAIGASVTANCEPCLHYHVNKAQEVGAKAEDIQAAIDMGQKVRRGSTANMGRVVSDVLESLGAPAAASDPAGGMSCCG